MNAPHQSRMHRVPRRLALSTLLSVLIAAPLAQAEEDWEAAAARAAQTEKGFYETGGARDTSVIPLPTPVPTPAPVSTSRSSQPQLSAAQRQRLQTAQQNLAQAQRQYQREMQSSRDRISNLQSQLDQARRDKETYEANLKSHRKDEGVVGTLANVFGQDRRANFLEGKIADAERQIQVLSGQVSTLSSAYRTRSGQIQQSLDNYQLQVIKADPAQRAAEIRRRTDELRELETEYETQRAQIEVTRESFKAQTDMFDTVIERAREQGHDALVEQLEKDRAKVVTRGQEVLESLQSQLIGHRKDRHEAWARNETDGLGPTNSGELRDNLRTQARAEGGDDLITTEDFVDSEVVARTALSAQRIGTGASRDTEHTNIFDNVGDSEAWREFALDYSDGALTLFRDPEKFAERYGNYLLGVGEAGVDAVKDLAVLAKEVGDTAAEASEQAFNYYTGSQSNLFGTENLDFVESGVRKGAALVQGGEEGQQVARDVVDMVGGALDAADRRFSRQAATGEAGLRQALRDTGYVTGTVVAVEEVAIRAGAATINGVRLWRAVDKVEDVADVAADANRASDAGRLETGAGAPSDAPTAPTQVGDSAAPAPRNPAGQNAIPAPRPFDPPAEVVVRTGPNGETILSRADGQNLALGEVLGKGGTSKTYSVPGRDDIVIKLTKEGGADVLDDAGYAVIRHVDPQGQFVEVPTIYQSYDVPIDGRAHAEFSGGRAVVVERAPETMLDARKGDLPKDPNGNPRMPDSPDGRLSLTDAQRTAYHRGLEALNEKGYVFLDNKHDNFSFKIDPETGEMKLVIVDPGSIVPMKGRASNPAEAAANARALQRALDTPTGQAVTEPWTILGSVPLGRAHHQQSLAQRFDALVDWEAIRRLTGENYSTLGPADINEFEIPPIFPFNPQNGRYYDNMARPETPVPLDAPAPRVQTANQTPESTSGSQIRLRPIPLNEGGPVAQPMSLGERVQQGTMRAEEYGAGTAVGLGVATGMLGQKEFPEHDRPAVSGTPLASPAPGVRPQTQPGARGGGTQVGSTSDGSDAGEGETALAVGGGQIIPVIEPIYFSFGPGVLPPEEETWISLPGEEPLISIRVISVTSGQQNNPFLPRDPLIQDAGNNVSLPPQPTPPPGGGEQIQVLPSGNDFIPISRFAGTSPRDACSEDHYHSSVPVQSCAGAMISDPAPTRCGYGPVSAVRSIPVDSCANP